jgi:hypothetical protein
LYFCQKFTNSFPRPVKKPNCHFEPTKKVYCYKEEVVTKVAVCDNTFSTHKLSPSSPPSSPMCVWPECGGWGAGGAAEASGPGRIIMSCLMFA